MFDIMDLEDDERNELLQLPDNKMQVSKCFCFFCLYHATELVMFSF